MSDRSTGNGLTFVVPQTHNYKCEAGHTKLQYSSRVHPEDVQLPCIHCGKHLTYVKAA